LLVRGRQDAASSDSITIDTVTLAGIPFVTTSVSLGTPAPGTDYTGPYTSLFIAGLVSSIEADTGAGLSFVNLLRSPNVPFTINSTDAIVSLGTGGNAQGVLGPITFTNTSGSGGLIVDDSADSTTHTITIADNGGPTFGQITGLTQGTINYRNDQLGGGGITIKTGPGTNVVNVYSTPSGVVSLEGHSANTTVNVGNGTTQNIRTGVTITNPPSFTTLTVDDSQDSGTRTTSINTWSFDSAYGEINGLSANNASIFYKYNDTSRVSINTGIGTNTVNVQDVVRPLTLVGNSSSTAVNVGKSGSLAGIQGPLTIGGVTAVVTINDANRGFFGITSPAVYTVTATTVQAPSAALISYGATAALTLDTGIAFTFTPIVEIDITGTRAGTNTTVNMNGGVNLVNVGGGTLDGIQGPLTVVGTVIQALTVNDQNSVAARTYTITPSTVAWASGPTLTYSSVASLTVNTGGGVDTVNVQGTLAGTPVTVNTGGGNDAINVERTSGPLAVNLGTGNDTVNISPSATNLNTIQGAVTITGNSDSDTLVVNDQFDTADQTYSLTATAITRPGAAAINFVSMRTVTLFGGSSANVYNITGTGAFQTTVFTGPGTDTVNVETTTRALAITEQGPNGNDAVNISPMARNLDSIQGSVAVAGNAGVDTLVVNDQNNSAAQTYSLGAGVINRSGVAISFASMSTVTLNGGSGGNQFNVQSTLAGATLALNGGSGTNTLVGPNVATTWNLSGSNAGTFSGGVSFSNFQNLTGGTGDDTFAFANGAGVSGTIDGGGGSNLLDYSPYATPVTVDLSANSATGVGRTVANIQQLRGGQSDDTLTGNAAGNTTFLASTGNDTLTGLGGGNTLLGIFNGTWNITAQNAGALTFGNNTTTFTGVQNLYGSLLGGTFVFADGAGVDGRLDGGSVGVLDESAYSTPVTVDLAASTATGVGGNVTNFQRFLGGAAGGNTLHGPNAPTTWNVTAQNAGTLTGGITFSAFQNLTGGSANDTFVLANGVGVDGNLDGGGGTNTLNEAAYLTPVTVDLTANTATGVGGSIANLQSFVGAGAGGNTLNGPPLANTTWSIMGSNAGTLTGGFSFSAFQNLAGGAGNNTFAIGPQAGAGVSGTVTGGSGGFNNLDYSLFTGDVVVDLQTGFATAIGGGLFGTFGNVHGANSGGLGLYNLLIGNGGNAVLTGGTGRRNILVAGGTPATLNAGTQEDLLIGGSTTYDIEPGLTSWQQIAAYWAGSDPFTTRVNNLENGVGVPLLDATIVTGNGGGNTINGLGSLALIYTDLLDTIAGFNAGYRTYPIAP
jgi:hypothetical protein